MAYDRYDTRDAPRDERSRWQREHQGREERGFFERAGDEVASWFGDEEAERRRREDQLRDERESRFRGEPRDFGRERSDFSSSRDWDRESGRRDWLETRGPNERGGFSERDYNPSWRRELSGPGNRERDWDREGGTDRGYRPMAGDYGRSDRSRNSGRSERETERFDSPWGSDEYRRTSRAGTSDWSDRSRHEDPHYRGWRERHMSELDRDYEEYRRENQARFEADFSSWRERRMRARALLGQVREHMEVVGNDDQHIGTVDCTAGDRIVLTRSDPESGGVHHSLSAIDIDRIEGDRVILDLSREQARERWRDESRDRALFERSGQGEMGPHVLERSFEGTYR